MDDQQDQSEQDGVIGDEGKVQVANEEQKSKASQTEPLRTKAPPKEPLGPMKSIQVEDGKRAPIDTETHRHVKVINLWKDVKALTVYNLMNRYSEDKRSPCVLGVDIRQSEKENEVSAIIRFMSKDSAFKAARLFSRGTNWKWNGRFRAKITEMTEFRVSGDWRGVVQFNTKLQFHLRYPEFLGQRIDDVMSDIRPGCVVHLPAGVYFEPNAGACVDVRFNNEIRGHPVIICTTFGGRNLEDVFRNRPEKMREFIEIDSTSGHRIRQAEMNQCEGPTSPRGLLTFGGDSRLPLKGYAGTTAYTTSLDSLARLQMECLKDVPGGYLKLYNLQLLLNRIKWVGDDPNAEYFTSDDPDSIRGKLPRRLNGRGILAASV
ncbi:hypothetical protein DL98DRAFT_590546 [Cadophora sp. DSE1049]|nr:hypothetical protein DL98DRAFT_590546 [Cadophora sp. DSE1049]